MFFYSRQLNSGLGVARVVLPIFEPAHRYHGDNTRNKCEVYGGVIASG